MGIDETPMAKRLVRSQQVRSLRVEEEIKRPGDVGTRYSHMRNAQYGKPKNQG